MWNVTLWPEFNFYVFFDNVYHPLWVRLYDSDRERDGSSSTDSGVVQVEKSPNVMTTLLGKHTWPSNCSRDRAAWRLFSKWGGNLNVSHSRHKTGGGFRRRRNEEYAWKITLSSGSVLLFCSLGKSLEGRSIEKLMSGALWEFERSWKAVCWTAAYRIVHDDDAKSTNKHNSVRRRKGGRSTSTHWRYSSTKVSSWFSDHFMIWNSKH